MSVVEMLKGRKAKATESPSLADKLAALTIDSDPDVLATRRSEAAVVHQVEESAVVLDQIKRNFGGTESRLRRALADGAPADELRKVRDAARDEVEAAVARAEGLGEKVVAVRQQVRGVEEEASKRVRVELVTLAATNTAERDALFQRLEALTLEASQIHDALEKACPQMPIVTSYGFTTGFIRPTFRPGWSVILGLVEQNPLTFVQRLFRGDPRAENGGMLATWRIVAKQSGLLLNDLADPDRELRQKSHEAYARRKEQADHARIDSVWGDTDRRDLSMK